MNVYYTIIVSLVMVGSCLAYAQRILDSGMIPYAQVGSKPTNCEFNVSVLTGAHRVAGDAGLVIMIARLGKGERKRELNRRRLHNARTFLTEFGGRDPQTIVTAGGERVDGYARLELYAGGRLFDVLLTYPHDDLAVGGMLIRRR